MLFGAVALARVFRTGIVLHGLQPCTEHTTEFDCACQVVRLDRDKLQSPDVLQTVRREPGVKCPCMRYAALPKPTGPLRIMAVKY